MRHGIDSFRVRPVLFRARPRRGRGKWRDDNFRDKAEVNPSVLKPFGVIGDGYIEQNLPSSRRRRYGNPFATPDFILRPVDKAQRERLEGLSLPSAPDRVCRCHRDVPFSLRSFDRLKTLKQCHSRKGRLREPDFAGRGFQPLVIGLSQVQADCPASPILRLSLGRRLFLLGGCHPGCIPHACSKTTRGLLSPLLCLRDETKC
jgi:hypothetical protein